MDVQVKKEGVLIPKDMFNDMIASYQKLDQIMSTIEIMLDKETMESIQKSKQQIENGEFVECTLEEVDKILS
ncbi:MAG: hypothetical protein MIO93_11310 [ANME-2 cluster archaeon]|nr:hypothetical protein [ANME-2 cluster archaeon]